MKRKHWVFNQNGCLWDKENVKKVERNDPTVFTYAIFVCNEPIKSLVFEN